MKRSGPLLEKDKKKEAKKNGFVIRRDKEKERSLAKYIKITTNGEKILPTEIKKYVGSAVAPKKSTQKWRAQINSKDNGGFFSKADAESYVKKENIKRGYTIKNIIYKYNNKYYCDLTQQQLMKFSPEHIDLVQKHVWFAHFQHYSYYAATSMGKKEGGLRTYHRFIHPELKKGESVDHVNRKTLDDTTENLRVATKKCQVINRRLSKNNNTGTTGVIFNEATRRYTVSWTDEEEKPLCKCFSIFKHGEEALSLAIAFRTEIENNLKHYKDALGK